MQYLPYDEAVAKVMQQTERLATLKNAFDADLEHDKMEMFAEKFVLDVLDYCHRSDFPRTLVYTGAELAVKYITDMNKSENAPLKSLKENDVQFEWAVKEVSPIGCISEDDFATIRGKLNLYRKVMWSNG